MKPWHSQMVRPRLDLLSVLLTNKNDSEVSRETGISRFTIAKIRRGEPVARFTLGKLADKLGIKNEDVITYYEDL